MKSGIIAGRGYVLKQQFFFVLLTHGVFITFIVSGVFLTAAKPNFRVKELMDVVQNMEVNKSTIA